MENKPPIPTKRERQFIDLLAQNRRYKEIAAELGIAINTVKHTASRMYRKFGMTRGRLDAYEMSAALRMQDLLKESENENRPG